MKIDPVSAIDGAAQRIAGVAIETPLLRSDVLDEISGANLLIKAECLQVTGSFKIRGAMNRLSQIAVAQPGQGVVAFSSGNHAQGVARAARLLGMPALIVMPRDAPKVKISGVRADGAEIHLYDRVTESREEIAANIAAARGWVLVPSFDDPGIIAGQGTVGREILRQSPMQIDHILTPIGGGGLASGICLAVEAERSPAQVWGAEPNAFNDWQRSLQSGKIEVNAPGPTSIADAILTPQPGEMTWPIAGARLVGVLAVSDEALRAAMRLAFRHLKIVAEPGGAAALAGALFHLPESLKGQTLAIVVSGGNVDPQAFAQILSEEK